MKNLSLKFLSQMEKILGDDYSKFLDCFEKNPVKALRVNSLLVKNMDGFVKNFPFETEKLNFLDNGFKLTKKHDGIGRLVSHHAGAFYVQDPSAMVAVCALDPKPGEKVLDLCAAPGGKSTQIAERLNGNGLLFSNEINKSRANILISNLERMGVKNAVVFSKRPSELCNEYCEYFDKVLVDAPCSGEGMFRKNSNAVLNWSLENSRGCALRQKEILNSAALALKPGGILVYSTCTFSTVENEEVIKWFLESRDDFDLEPIDVDFGAASPFSDIIPNAFHTKRIYPFHGGEGQFIARLKKSGGFSAKINKFSSISKIDCFSKFWDQTFDEPIPDVAVFGDRVMVVPSDMPNVKNAIVAGIFAGRLKNNRFVPNHHLFKCDIKIKNHKLLNLSFSDKVALDFIAGKEIFFDSRGYCGVRVDGIPLGFGKCSCKKLKNHYPKGLRQM